MWQTINFRPCLQLYHLVTACPKSLKKSIISFPGKCQFFHRLLSKYLIGQENSAIAALIPCLQRACSSWQRFTAEWPCHGDCWSLFIPLPHYCADIADLSVPNTTPITDAVRAVRLPVSLTHFTCSLFPNSACPVLLSQIKAVKH